MIFGNVFKITLLLYVTPFVLCATSIVDDIGNRFTFPPYPRRIISLAPNITEILFYLNAGNRVVGVTNNCNYPEKAKSIEKIGGFINPNIEKIVTLKPDIVIGTTDGNNPQSIKKINNIGIKTFIIKTDTIYDIPRVISMIANITDRRKNANEFKIKFNEATKKNKTKAHNRKKILFLLDVNPFITAGRGTFINDLILISGGKNIFDDSSIKYPKIDRESIIMRDPDVVLLSDDLKGKSHFSMSGKEVIYIDADTILRPSPRILDGIEILGSILKIK